MCRLLCLKVADTTQRRRAGGTWPPLVIRIGRERSIAPLVGPVSRRAWPVARTADDRGVHRHRRDRNALPDLCSRPRRARSLRPRQHICALARFHDWTGVRLAGGVVYRAGTVPAGLAAARRPPPVT